MSMYVFAPAGPAQLRNTLLKLGVEYIGSKQTGFGSSWSKGKRFIKKKLDCSGTAVKRACLVRNKVFNHKFEDYGTEVFYYHKDCCVQIVELILNYLVEHIEDPSLPQAFRKSNITLLDKTYSHRISQLHWVAVFDYRGQGEDAERIYNALNAINYDEP